MVTHPLEHGLFLSQRVQRLVQWIHDDLSHRLIPCPRLVYLFPLQQVGKTLFGLFDRGETSRWHAYHVDGFWRFGPGGREGSIPLQSIPIMRDQPGRHASRWSGADRERDPESEHTKGDPIRPVSFARRDTPLPPRPFLSDPQARQAYPISSPL